MGQYTLDLGPVPPGSRFFSVEFGDDAYASRISPIDKIDYVISHSIGGPGVGEANVTEN